MLYFAKDKRALHFHNPVYFGQLFKSKPVVGIQVLDDNLQKEIVDAACGITFHNLINILYLLFETLDMLVIVYGQ